MTDWICKEVQTDNGGYLEPVNELIRCKDCTYYRGDHEYCVNDMFAIESGFCNWAERKDEYVTLHHDDIHFKDEESEKAFYDALAERKEE